jgi:hypothetical protein
MTVCLKEILFYNEETTARVGDAGQFMRYIRGSGRRVTKRKGKTVMNPRSLVMFCIILLIPFTGAAGDSPWDARLPFKEAVITYKLSGMESGQEKLYIREYGKKTARYRTTSTTVLGITQTTDSVEIVTPDWVYSFDLKKGTGTRSVNPQKLMIEEYRALTADEKARVDANAVRLAGALAGGLQGTVQPDARTILGYSCDRVTALGTSAYTIHNSGIALLTESTIMGVTITSTAVAITTQGADETYFEFPRGIDPQPSPEKDETAAMIANQTIALLKDPQSKQAGRQGLIGMPSAGQEAIQEEDRQEMQKAMETIKGLFGN